jgi:hypothetical protein
MEKINFNFIKGDTYTRGITIEGLEVPIEQMYFTVKENSSDRNYVLQKKLEQGITIDPDNPNRYILLIQADDTNNLKTKYNYVFDVQIVTIPLDETIYKKTIIGGNFRLDDWDITAKRNEV